MLHIYIYTHTPPYLPLKDFIDENVAEVEFGVIQSRHPAELLRCLEFASKGEGAFLHNEAPFGEEKVLPRTVCRPVITVLCFSNPQT